MGIQIYHNNRCSKSRQGLAIIEEAGKEVEIIKYLENPPSKKEMKEILAKLNIPAKELVRQGEAIFKERYKGLDLNEDEWIQAMIENPKLIERPIVVNGYKAVVGRPPEKIKEII
jgi:arsenate reductase